MTPRTRTALNAVDSEGSRGPGRHSLPERARAGWPLLAIALCLLAALAGLTPKSQAQGFGDKLRVVQGKVLDQNDKPQPNAIVYLQNQKTQEIRTYITIADGSYRFGQLSSDVDYRLWAKLQGLKSKTRSISSFDSKKQFFFDLKLEPAK